MVDPICTEIISFKDLIGMVAPRILNRFPELSGPNLVIDVSMVPGQGIRIDVLGVPRDA
jgi:hypothetical protein